MPQSSTSAFDFTGTVLAAPPAASSSGTSGFDFGGTVLAGPPAPAASPSVLGRATDFLLSPLITPEQVQRATGAPGPLPETNIFGSLLQAVEGIPDIARNLIAEPGATLRGFAQGAAESVPVDAARNLITQPVATVKGFGRGMAEGAATLSDPVDIAALLAGGAGRAVRPALVRALRALPEAERALVAMRLSGNLPETKQLIAEVQALRSQADISRALLKIVRGTDIATGATVGAHGAERLMNAETLPEAGAGLAELGFGALGMRGATRVPEIGPGVGTHVGELPAAQGYRVTPSGEAVRAGEVVPETAAPDASFVRAVPAELAQREPRALLPESAQASQEFVTLPDGTVVRRGELPQLEGRSSAGQPVTAAPVVEAAPVASTGRRGGPHEAITRLAAIMDRTPHGEPIFSSDVNAAPIRQVPLNDLERSEIRRMLAEMENIPFTPHTYLRDEQRLSNIGGSLEVVPGAAGAPVYQDVLDIRGGGSISRQGMIDAMQKTLAGEPSTYGPAIRHVARARLAGAGGVSRPMLPPDAGDLPQSGELTDQDFDEFSRYLDRLAGEEVGAAKPALVQQLSGAIAGGVSGAASGDDTEDRIKRGLIGAGAGFLGATALAGGAARVPPVGSLHEPATARPLPDSVIRRKAAEAVRLPTTERPAGAPVQSMRDPLAGVETFVEKFPEQVRGGIRDILEQNRGFEAQRRGAVSQEQTVTLAQGVAIDLSRRLKPGTALNAESIRTFTDNLAATQAKINTLAERVNTGRATDADVVALEQARAEAATLAASIMGARSEAGRALAQFKVLARVLATGNPRRIQEAANGLRGEASEFAAAFAELPDDPLARYRWLQAHEQPSLMDRARSYFYANILSGVKTHERNVLGNLFNAIANTAVQPFAAGADLVRSTITGQPRTVLFSELPQQAVGALAGLRRGVGEMLFALRNGVTKAQLSGALSAAEAGKLDLPRVEFTGGGANPFNWPGRALDAADQFFRATARDAELYGVAFAQARREGLSGRALTDRMADLVAGTSEAAQAVQQQADTFARRAVFQEPGGRLVKGLQTFAKQYPPISFVIPFIKTPASIFRQGAEFSPAGFLMRGSRAGGREGAQALARASAGSIGAAYLAYLAATGQLSGSGPTSPAERAQLMESGWRPDSVKVGDKWISYQLFQPLSVPAAAIANAFEAWRDAGADASTVDKVYAGVMRSVRSALNESFLSGLSDLVSAIEDSDNALGAAERYAGRTIGSFVPFTGAMRTVAQATDEKVRKPRSVGEGVKAGIPGLSTSVPARLDRFGREVVREGGPLKRAADPFNTSTEVDDSVLKMIDRLGLTVGMPTGRVDIPGRPRSERLPEDEQRAVQVAVGRAHYAALARLNANPDFAALALDVQQRIAEKALRQATTRVTNAARTLLRRGQPITTEGLQPSTGGA